MPSIDGGPLIDGYTTRYEHNVRSLSSVLPQEEQPVTLLVLLLEYLHTPISPDCRMLLIVDYPQLLVIWNCVPNIGMINLCSSSCFPDSSYLWLSVFPSCCFP